MFKMGGIDRAAERVPSNHLKKASDCREKTGSVAEDSIEARSANVRSR